MIKNNLNLNSDFNELNIQYFHENRFAQFTKSLESRISLIFFITIFFPIMGSFLLILQKLTVIFYLIFIPLQILLLKILLSVLMKDETKLFGIMLYEEEGIKNEYNEYLSFLINLVYFLSFLNPEHAIIKAYENCNKFLKEKFKEIMIKLMHYNISLEKFFIDMQRKLKGIKTKLLCNALSLMINKSSYYSSTYLIDLLKVLKDHKKLEEERENIIIAQKFKVRLFTIILPFILGLFSSIFPVFQEFLATSTNINNSLIPFSIYILHTGDLVIIIISNLIIALISGYYLHKLLNIMFTKFQFLLIILVYLLSLIVSSHYINIIIVNFTPIF